MSLDVYLNENYCTHCGRSDEVFQANITHNLTAMANEAGIYDIIWYPEANGIDTAGQLIEPLRVAIDMMKADPERFKKHDAANGWGLYEHFVPWLEEYWKACTLWPHAKIKVSR